MKRDIRTLPEKELDSEWILNSTISNFENPSYDFLEGFLLDMKAVMEKYRVISIKAMDIEYSEIFIRYGHIVIDGMILKGDWKEGK